MKGVKTDMVDILNGINPRNTLKDEIPGFGDRWHTVYKRMVKIKG